MGGTDGEVGNTVVFRKEEVGPTLVAPLRAGMRFSQSGQNLAAESSSHETVSLLKQTEGCQRVQ